MSSTSLTTETVLESLRGVVDPASLRDIVSLSMVHDLAIREGTVWLTVRLNPATAPSKARFENEILEKLENLEGLEKIELRFESQTPQASPGAAPAPVQQGVPGVRHIIAVGSGKGGVGKTTVSVNLAIALTELGLKVGLLDADVYGPNVPTMMGVSQVPKVLPGNMIEPLSSFGVRLMSMGFVSPGDKPVIWRGPMLHSAMQQFLRQVAWGELDYLIIDLPPGTGDISLSLAQNVALTGAVVVTTPSDVSLEDGRKALNMFKQLKVDVLGLVENMSLFTCPHCHQEVDIFSHGGGERTAAQFGVPYLGALPLLPEVRQGGDRGRPIAVEAKEAEAARPFYSVARRLLEEVEHAGAHQELSDILHVRA